MQLTFNLKTYLAVVSLPIDKDHRFQAPKKLETFIDSSHSIKPSFVVISFCFRSKLLFFYHKNVFTARVDMAYFFVLSLLDTSLDLKRGCGPHQLK